MATAADGDGDDGGGGGGYLRVYSAFCSRDTYDRVFQATLARHRDELAVLGAATSCLVFGPGEGRHEVWLIENCLANVTRLIAVEPDRQSAERLRVRLARRLSRVSSQVLDTSIQGWTGS